MANRYWVGGSGIWDSTNTANWSATTGGAGGASVPTSGDDVFFDTGATNFVVSVAVGQAICKNISVTIATAGRLTFDGYLGVFSYIDCYGTAAINAATTISSSAPISIYFYAASGAISVSTNNVKFYRLSFGYGGASTATFTLGSGLTAQNLELASGTLNTNGQTVTLTTQYYYAISTNCEFYISGADAKTLTLGTSAINIGTSASEWPGGSATFNLESGSGLTLNANTSVITVGSTNTTNWNNSNLYGGNFTFATVVLNGNYSNITGANTFTTRFAKNAVFNESILKVWANQTLNSGHTLQLIGTAAARLLVLSDEARTQRTFTLLGTTGTRTLSYVSFMDIAMSFGSSLTGTSVGDMLNNSGITFTAPVTRYLVLGGAGKDFSSTTAWSTTSGGATGASVPLPQDTVIFDLASDPTGTGSITFDTLYLGATINATGFIGSTVVGYIPNYVLGQTTGTPLNFFPGETVFRFNSNINLPSGLFNPFTIDGGSATATMSAALNLPSSGINVLSGNFDTNSYNLTSFYLRSSAPSITGAYQNRGSFTASTYTFRSSLLVFTNYLTPLLFQTGDTVNANTSTVEFTSTSTSTIAPSLANKTLYNLKLTPGSTAATYSGLSGSTFNDITLSAHTSLIKINLTAGQTVTTGSLNVNGTKGAGVIIGANITSTSGVTSNATLAIGSNVVTEYVAFLGITKSGASNLDARGAADLGANSGISFQQHSVIAFSGSGASSFTVPNNFTGSSYMLVVGAGGGAGKRSASNVSAGGGGSGALALVTNLNISAGQTIYLNSPTGGAGATASGAGGSPANAWINIAANSQPTLVTNGAYADSGNGSPGSGSNSAGQGGNTTATLGQLELAGVAGRSGEASSALSTYGAGGSGGSPGNLIFRTAKAGGVSISSNGGGGGGSIENTGDAAQVFGQNGGAGGAVGANPGGTAGVGGASPTAGGNATAGTGAGGGGGGGSTSASVNSGAGGNGSTGSQWAYNSLNGVAGGGSIGYGGGGGAGGGISSISLTGSAGGAGGSGGIGAGGGGGGRGSTSGGATGNGGSGGASMVLFVYVEARGGNFATIIG